MLQINGHLGKWVTADYVDRERDKDILRAWRFCILSVVFTTVVALFFVDDSSFFSIEVKNVFGSAMFNADLSGRCSDRPLFFNNKMNEFFPPLNHYMTTSKEI